MDCKPQWLAGIAAGILLSGSSISAETFVTTYTYDDMGNVVAQTDAEERTQRVLYDALGRSTGQVDAAGQTNSVSYGFMGQVDGLVDANGNLTQWGYDPLGQLKTKTYDDNTQVNYTYDDAGRIQTKTDANGWHTKYAYDAVGNLLTNSFHGATNASASRTVVYTYDDLGRIESYDDEVTSGSIVYDDANFAQTLTVTYTNGHSMVTESIYDPSARTMTKIYGGTTNIYAYGVDGKLEGVHVPGQGWVNYHYDQRGLNDRITLPGGVQRISEFDGLGRLKAKRVEDSGGANILTQAYQRRLSGSIWEKSTDMGVWNYSYDLIDQLTNALFTAADTSEQEWGYDYDAMGNRSTDYTDDADGLSERAYAANELNQYTSITSSVSSVVDLQYDLNGNLTNDNVKAYFWDLQDQLIAVEALDRTAGFQPTSSAARVEYTYDAMGRRVTKSVYEWDTQVSSFKFQVSSTFFYDGWNMVREIVEDLSDSPAPPVTRSYTWGNDLSGSLQGAGGVGGLLCMQTFTSAQPQVPSASYYPLYDHNGNVEKYIRGNGLVVAEYQYDGFGSIIHEFVDPALQTSNSQLQTFPILFSTKYWDVEIAMNYYGYRYYSPGLGRWIKRDPLGEDGGNNLFAFCLNRLPNGLDMLGLDYLDCLAGCIEQNDPMNIIIDLFIDKLEAKLALSAAGKAGLASIGIPKKLLAWTARAVGKVELAKKIELSARMGGPLAYKPMKMLLMALKVNRAKAAMAARSQPYVLIVYGTVMVAIEVDCAIHCKCKESYEGGNLFNTKLAANFYMNLLFGR